MKVYIKWIATDHTYTMTIDVSNYDAEKNSTASLLNWVSSNKNKFLSFQIINRDDATYGHRIRIEDILISNFENEK